MVTFHRASDAAILRRRTAIRWFFSIVICAGILGVCVGMLSGCGKGLDTDDELITDRPLMLYALSNGVASNETISAYRVNGGKLSLNQTVQVTTTTSGTRSMAIDRSSRVVFVIASIGGQAKIVAYTVNPETGLLTARAPVQPANCSPDTLGVHPSLDLLYVGCTFGGSARIESFQYAGSTGALGTESSLVTVSVGVGTIDTIAVNPLGSFLYVGAHTAKTYSLNLDGAGTPALQGFYPGPHPAQQIVLPQNGSFAMAVEANGASFESLRPNTNTTYGTLAVGASRIGINPAGTMALIWNGLAVRSYSITASSISAVIDTMTTVASTDDLKMSPRGDLAFLAESASGTIRVVSVSAAGSISQTDLVLTGSPKYLAVGNP